MRILFGITGGIAAYKSASAVRFLTELGHDVKVIPTANALRFIGAATLEALSHNSIDPDLYTDIADVKHIKLAQEADLILVAPASASFIARYATGIADDLLLNVLLATKAKVILAPAMHTEMWEHPATQENLEKLRARGVEIINPVSGRLTGKDSGIGRMAEPEDIVSTSLAFFSKNKDFEGKRLVIAAGGTREAIDAVRFIGNSSSGKQGLALARNARDRGAQVTLIAANIDLPMPNGVEVIRLTTAAELEEALEALFEVDAIIMPVAVSDYRVAEPSKDKLHRDQATTLDIELISNPDILLELSNRRAGSIKPLLVGFSAEVAKDDSQLKELAVAKFERKNIDLIVANNIRNGAVFGEDSNAVIMIGKDLEITSSGTKDKVAAEILDQVIQLLS